MLAPFLFSLYIDDILSDCARSGYGEILLYADDILIITRSVTGLQYILKLVEDELTWLDLRLNCAKSVCIRIGIRFDYLFPVITTDDGIVLHWVSCLRYLGSHFLSGRRFASSFDANKRAFCRAVNNIIGKIGNASQREDVLLHLIKFKCLPILLYSTECVNANKRSLASLDFCVVKFLMKIFKTSNRLLANDCIHYLGFSLPSDLVARRVELFMLKLKSCSNALVNQYL